MKYLKHVLGGIALAAAVAAASVVIYKWWKDSGKVSVNQIYFLRKVLFDFCYRVHPHVNIGRKGFRSCDESRTL